MKKIFILCILSLVIGTCPANAGIFYQNTITPMIATNMQVDNIKNLKCGKCQIFHCLGLVDVGHAGIQKPLYEEKLLKYIMSIFIQKRF